MKSGLAIALAVTLIAAATLLPTGTGGGGSGICILCGERGAADFLLNVALFGPLGAVLAARRLSLPWALVTGAVLSGLIEIAQVTVVSGRDANIGDPLANTMGAGAGWLALAGWARSRSLAPLSSALLAIILAGAAAALVLVGLWLFTPSYPPTTYFLQWMARFGHMEAYGGEVLASRVGPLELPGPPGPIERSDSVRELLREGAPIEAVVRADVSPAGLAPIFSIYDGRQREIFLLGAEGVDLVYRYRLLAETVRLDRGELRFPGALQGISEGQVVRIGVARDGPRYCASVDDRSVCTRGFTAGDTWTLLYYRPEWSHDLRGALGLVWLAGLFFPAGLLAGRWRHRGAAALVAVLGLTLGPLLSGLTVTPLRELLAALIGVGVGGAFAERFHGARWRPIDSPLERDSLSA